MTPKSCRAWRSMRWRIECSLRPELTDLSKESEKTFERYGPDARTPGTFAFNCILARRLAERGVRFIQLFHRGWDQHGDLPKNITKQAQDTDQPSAALIMDLKERGMLDDTLVIWGGEFGRTVYSDRQADRDQLRARSSPALFYGLACRRGNQPGITIGETDDFSYNITSDPAHVPRLKRDNPTLFGHRSHLADIQIPG